MRQEQHTCERCGTSTLALLKWPSSPLQLCGPCYDARERYQQWLEAEHFRFVNNKMVCILKSYGEYVPS